MTERHKQFILENYGSCNTNAIASYCGCSTATVVRYARKFGLDIRKPSTSWSPSKEQLSYFMRNYGNIPTRYIADVLGVSVSRIRSLAKRLGLRITREQLEDLKTWHLAFIKNPNPVTDTTKMLICRYYFEGEPISVISALLGREKSLIISILRECQNNGLYRNYNLYGHLIPPVTPAGE